ncbi:MAG: hypothetical protein IPK04_21955 [Bdellovibrionales bacterium]|nr:hypothetical protein [Bdellovibrionales bacterium]
MSEIKPSPKAKPFGLTSIITYLSFCLHSQHLQAEALKLKHRWEIAGSAQGTQLNQEGFSELKNKLDGLVLLGLEQSGQYKNWSFEFRPELKIWASPAFTTPPNDSSRFMLDDPKRALNLHNQVYPASGTTTKTEMVTTDIEKLNLKYRNSYLDLTLGRNPFNPSIMRLSPIWNKFNKDIFFSGDPNLQFNPDIAAIRITQDKFWVQNANVFTRDSKSNSYLLIGGYNFKSVELQFLGGQMLDETAFGSNLSIATSKSLIKAEILTIITNRNSEAKHSQGALGFENSWTDSFSTISEFMVSTLSHQFQDSREISEGASPFLKLRSEYYLLNQFDYQFSEVWTGSLIPILNLSDSSQILSAALKANLSDNFEMNIQAKISGGSDFSEFGAKSLHYTNGSYQGFNNSAGLTMKYFFN